jgi:hypothetical protein
MVRAAATGLGDRFVVAVGAAIVRASRWPNAGTSAIHDGNGEVVERRVATSGFPYAVRYRVEPPEADRLDQLGEELKRAVAELTRRDHLGRTPQGE